MLINFNGQIAVEGIPIFFPSNRAFKYGDGLFESIRVFEGKMPFLAYHWQRLSLGIKLLRLNPPAHFTIKFFQAEIEKLTNAQGNWRIRMTFWRTGTGLYTPSDHGIEFLIEATPLTSPVFELNAVGLTVGIYEDALLPCQSNGTSLGSLKTVAALPYVVAAIFKTEKSWDDCLMKNTKDRLACASSANIFWVKNKVLATPSLQEGCIAGTMRQALLELSSKIGVKAIEKPFSMRALESANEVFITNAVQGIRWVREIKPFVRVYGNDLALRLVNDLQLMLIAKQGMAKIPIVSQSTATP